MIQRISEKLMLQMKLFAVKDIELQLTDGTSVAHQIVEKADTAFLVPIDNDDNVVSIKEHYTAIGEYQLGLPKSKIEDEYTGIETANKELQEEVGFKAQKLDQLGILTMSPEYFSQKTHVLLARGLFESSLIGNGLGQLDIIKLPFSQFETVLNNRRLTGPRMIAALYLAKRFIDIEEKQRSYEEKVTL